MHHLAEYAARLSDHDLRDYYWLSRDRVTGLSAGVGLMPARLRKTLGLLLAGEPQANKELLTQLTDLDTDEQDVLLHELEQRLTRAPADAQVMKAWEAVMPCIDSAPGRLTRVLEGVSAKSISSVTPMKLAAVVQNHPALAKRGTVLLDNWETQGSSKTKKAASMALKQLRKGK
jgi:hypothetical protein